MHNISWFLTLHETYNSGHRQGSIGYVIFLHITESVGSTFRECGFEGLFKFDMR